MSKASTLPTLAFAGLTAAQIAPAAAAEAGDAYRRDIGRTCTNSSTCAINFGAVPGNRPMRLSNVSCRVTIDDAQATNADLFIYNAAGRDIARQHLQISWVSSINPSRRWYSLNDVVNDVVPRRGRIEASVNLQTDTPGGASFVILNCTVSGIYL